MTEKICKPVRIKCVTKGKKTICRARAGRELVAKLIERDGEITIRIAKGREQCELEKQLRKQCAINECGTSYADFRSGWTFKDAAEMLGGRGKGGPERSFRPSRKSVLWMLGKLKREDYERHQAACVQRDKPDVVAYWESISSEDFPSFD